MNSLLIGNIVNYKALEVFQDKLTKDTYIVGSRGNIGRENGRGYKR